MKIPRVKIVEWIDGNKVRLFFSSGKVVEMKLPWVKDARNAQIVDDGMGLDPGDGFEVSSLTLLQGRCKTLVEGRRGWTGSQNENVRKSRHRRTSR